MKNSSDTIGNQTRDLSTCSAVPQLTALRSVPLVGIKKENIPYLRAQIPGKHNAVATNTSCAQFKMQKRTQTRAFQLR